MILPHQAEIETSARNATALRLPFAGRWLVVWGGDTAELNQHHGVAAQRFAFDFLGVDAHDATQSGAGKRNEDYFAYGREILAPADGSVTEVIDGLHDNAPGSMNPFSALGNAVFLQHSSHEVSVFAHLQPNSIRVKPGEKVRQGVVLGLCGNSGNSSEPHLHYHLQNTPAIEQATGIKCYFESVRVTRNGKTEMRSNYSPVKDDIIAAD